eukprot:tig00000042_g15504.t1
MLHSGPSGFSNAPVTKALLLLCGGTSVVSSLLNARYVLSLDVRQLMQKFQLWRLFTHNWLFLSPGELLFGMLLLYYFRIFERQMGSSKYAAMVSIFAGVSTLLQLVVLVPFRSFRIAVSGPYGILFGALVQFFAEIPVTYRFRVAGAVTLSDKSFTYLMAAQLVFSSFPASLLGAVCGIAAGCVYRSEGLRLRRVEFPGPLVRLCTKYLLPLLATETSATRVTTAPGLQPQAPPGADPHGTQGNFDTLLGPGRRAGPAMPMGAPQAPAPPREEDVATLESMGFSRAAAMEALRRAGGDLGAATELLLDGR